MSIASRLPVLVGMVLGTVGCGAKTNISVGQNEGALTEPQSEYCRQLAAGGGNECRRPVCVGEKTVTVSAETLCESEVRARRGRGTTFDCEALCGDGPGDTVLCQMPEADQAAMIALGERTSADGCPYFASKSTQTLLCTFLGQTGDRPCAVEGRRPAGWTARGGGGADPVGAYLASCAELEAISVDAFRELAAELAFHGAPRALVDGCTNAAREEIMHASLVGDLARRFGADVPAIVREPRTSVRSFVDIARENAVEGLVRELFGAAQARVRASCARDPEIRAVMKRVADDEARHADLSVALDAWLAARLTDEEQAEVDAAVIEARRTLRGEIQRMTVDGALQDRAGVPSRDVALALFDRLFDGNFRGIHHESRETHP